MNRNVYLQGELGEKFGKKFSVNTDNYADIIKCINVNRPGFLNFIRQCHFDGINFTIERNEEYIGEESLLLPIREGDVTIALVPAGAKSGFAKIIAAVALFMIAGPAGELLAASTGTGSFLGMSATTITAGITGMAVNLALTGIQQLMAPDPATDQDEPTNYLFSGEANNAKEGDPIPLLYGELRVPGRPISINIINGGRPGNNNLQVAGSGDINQIGGAHTQHH